MAAQTGRFQIEVNKDDEYQGTWTGESPSGWMKRNRFIEYVEREFRFHRCNKCGDGFTKTFNRERHEEKCKNPGTAVEEELCEYKRWKHIVRNFTDVIQLEEFLNILPRPRPKT